jgi:hypothetical protein
VNGFENGVPEETSSMRGLIANASLVGLFGTMRLIGSHLISDFRALKVPSFKVVNVGRLY